MKKLYISMLVFLVSTVVAFGQQQTLQMTSQNGDLQVEQMMATQGQTITDFVSPDDLRSMQTEVNPGIDPEGDYVHRMAYSGDGAYLLQTNALTSNVTIFDAQTMAVVANVDVGFFPVDVACTNDYAVVPCVFADSVFVISLETFEVAASFPTAEQPAVVEVSNNGSKAYVGCDVDDVLEVINLDNLEHENSLSGFPVALRSANLISGSGRFYYLWRDFLVAPDDQYLITGDFDTKVIKYDLATGTIADEIDELGFVTELNLSGDGEKLIAVEYNTPATVYQISYPDFEVLKSVTLTDLGIWGGGVAVNPDGSKAYLGVNGNQTGLIRFDTEDFLLFPATQTAFWCANTYDHQFAVSGQYRFSIFDFEQEIVRGSYWGITQYLGAVSPVGYQAVGADPGRFEGPAFYDFADPQVVNFKGQVPSGEMPEGDVPYRAAVADDGSKAVVVNNLSGTVSIINLDTYEVDAVIDIGEAGYEVKITHDSKWAVVGGYDQNTVKIIDLETNELATTVGTGQRPMMISIAPDDSYAYVGNLKGNTVAFVKLDGANSSTETIIPVGVIGLNWSAYGVRSGVKVSPTGEYLLVAASFDDNVKVIDTELQEIVATIAVGDFPLQLDFNSSGSHAVVANYSDNTFSVIEVDGANSSLVGTFNAANSSPIRLKYNTIKNEMSIVHLSGDQTILNIDATTGEVLSSYAYPQYGSPYQIDFDPDGMPLLLTAPTDTRNAMLLHGDFGYELPSSPIQFGYSPDAQIAVIAEGGGGPDNVTVIDFVTTGLQDGSAVNQVVYKPFYITSISPNPATANAEISLWKNKTFRGDLVLEIRDAGGRLVKTAKVSATQMNAVNIDVSSMNSGFYYISVTDGNHVSTRTMIVR